MKNKPELIKQLEKANAKELEQEFYNTDAILKENEKPQPTPQRGRYAAEKAKK